MLESMENKTLRIFTESTCTLAVEATSVGQKMYRVAIAITNSEQKIVDTSDVDRCSKSG